MNAGLLLFLFLPFLLSLFGRGRGHPPVLCFFSGVMAVLLTAEPHRAALAWTLGLAIAVVSLRERFSPPV